MKINTGNKGNIFTILGIGTDVGKTLVSAILTECLQADYWKPIQTGTTLGKDSDFIRENISNKKSVIHPELFLFPEPVSPHQCFETHNSCFNFSAINIPDTQSPLVLETAGGLLSPIDHQFLMVDFLQFIPSRVVLVVKHYLGSINHTLLALEYLRFKQIEIDYLVFNGQRDSFSENLILKKHSSFAPEQILYIPEISPISPELIKQIADSLSI